MFDLDGSDSPNEFIEIYNISSNPTNLMDWFIADKLSTDDLFTDNFTIQPNQFALILEGDYDGFYDHIIPNETMILTVDDLSIGNGLGNSQDSLYLISNNGDTVSAIGWNQGITAGYSLEKIAFELDDTPNNWHHSVDSLGTPGFANSVGFMTIDVAIDSVFHSPENPKVNDEITIFIQMVNVGLYEVTSSVFVNQEFEQNVQLEPNEFYEVELGVFYLPSGRHLYNIVLSTENDFNTENNSVECILDVAYAYGDVLINEIMYNPITGEPEWVEITNKTYSEINILDWTINDIEAIANPPITESFIFFPDSMMVISEDSVGNFIYAKDFPGLNNTGDDIFLLDPTGQMIDHVQYHPDWGGGDGYSLERITHYLDSNNESNWGASVNEFGSTPNKNNSLFIESIEESGIITLDPNPFSPDGDGHEDDLFISYHLPFTQSILMADIYDSVGRKMTTLSAGKHVAMEGILVWNGKDDRNISCRVGQYLLVVEAVNAYSNQSWETVERIILAKKW